jgi:hypothetical protein
MGDPPTATVITYQLAKWRKVKTDRKEGWELVAFDIPTDRLNLFHTLVFFLADALHNDPSEGRLDDHAAIGVGRSGLNLGAKLGLPADIGRRPARPPLLANASPLR